MNIGGSEGRVAADALLQSEAITPEERRTAVAMFEQWQQQWPALFRGEAWLHLERLKKAVADPHGR